MRAVFALSDFVFVFRLLGSGPKKFVWDFFGEDQSKDSDGRVRSLPNRPIIPFSLAAVNYGLASIAMPRDRSIADSNRGRSALKPFVAYLMHHFFRNNHLQVGGDFRVQLAV